ncbi:MAG TPA: FHA domain-containing protein, partial [Acetobacteraceae bacterium]|nr:FHA domain-containing protein [Acetobacteraceae bacterium]
MDGVAVAESDEDLTERTISFRSDIAPRTQVETAAHLLLILADNAPPRHVTLGLLPLIVGRTAPAEVLLEGSSVSRRHCRLERQNDSVVLTDLAST